jgi:hypothetical protein
MAACRWERHGVEHAEGYFFGKQVSSVDDFQTMESHRLRLPDNSFRYAQLQSSFKVFRDVGATTKSFTDALDLYFHGGGGCLWVAIPSGGGGFEDCFYHLPQDD